MRQPGRYWPIDENGFLLSDADRKYLTGPFDRAVKAAVQVFADQIGPDIDSIYVTGSIARGRAIEGRSDLDLVVVLAEETDPELVKQDWINPAINELVDAHPLITGVELELWPYGYVFRDPEEFSSGAFIITTQSICVWGADLTPQLPRYNMRHGITRKAIANDDIIQFEFEYQDAVEALQQNPGPTEIHYWATRLSKKLLRTGFSLVMLQEGSFTRDLDLCAEAFSRHYPHQAAAAKHALEYIDNPPDDPARFLTFLQQYGSWMVDQCDKWLDEHNPDYNDFFVVGDDPDYEP